MSAIFKTGSTMIVAMACWLGALANLVHAADSTQWAGLRIVHALGKGRGKLEVKLNGQAWQQQGMELGEVSSLRRLKPGLHQLDFSREGLKSRNIRLNLKAGEILTLLPHAHRNVENKTWSIDLFKLDFMNAGSERIATVVDLGTKAHRLFELKQVGKSWTTMALQRAQPKRFDIEQPRGYLPLRVEGQQLSSLPVFEEGHHVIVLFEQESGELSILCYRDRSWPPVIKPEPKPKSLPQ